jgi:hypothetical protein
MIKSPEQAICYRLETDPLVAAKVGLRLYPLLAPSSATLPLIVYQRISIDRQPGTFNGVVGVPLVSVTLEIYAATYAEAREIADMVRSRLDGWGGEVYGLVVSRVSITDESDSVAVIEGGELPPVYQISQDYSVLWQEA